MSITEPALPDDDKGIGHNSGADPAAAREAFGADVDAFLKGLDIWTQRGDITEATAPKANDFLTGLKRLEKKAEAMCKDQRKPHMDAAAAVSAAWKPLSERIEKAIAVITPMLNAYKRKADEAARAKAAAAAAEAEKLRRAEEDARLAAAHAASESERIKAEEQAAALEKQAKTQEKAATKTSAVIESASGLANRRGGRKVWACEITNITTAALHFRNEPELQEVIKKLAGQALRSAPTVKGEKEVPAIPGIKFTYEETV